MDKNVKEQTVLNVLTIMISIHGKERRLCLKLQWLQRLRRIMGRIRRCQPWCRLWWWRQRQRWWWWWWRYQWHMKCECEGSMTKNTNVYYISLPLQNPNQIALHHHKENRIIQKLIHICVCVSPYLHHLQFCFSPLTIRNHVRRRGILVSHICITLSVLWLPCYIQH